MNLQAALYLKLLKKGDWKDIAAGEALALQVTDPDSISNILYGSLGSNRSDP